MSNTDEPVPGLAPQPARADRPAQRVVVDGETFDVRTDPRRPGATHYDWVSGPNADYGFGTSRSNGAPSTPADHEQAIRGFLAQIDPATGYIGPD